MNTIVREGCSFFSASLIVLNSSVNPVSYYCWKMRYTDSTRYRGHNAKYICKTQPSKLKWTLNSPDSCFLSYPFSFLLFLFILTRKKLKAHVQLLRKSSFVSFIYSQKHLLGLSLLSSWTKFLRTSQFQIEQHRAKIKCTHFSSSSSLFLARYMKFPPTRSSWNGAWYHNWVACWLVLDSNNANSRLSHFSFLFHFL